MKFELTLKRHPNFALAGHAKGHWRKKAGLTRDLRAFAKLLCLAKKQNRERWKVAIVHYEFYFPDNLERDAANAIQCMKPAIDGCVDAGVIAKDCWQALSIGRVNCSIDRENPRTVLIFEELVKD